MFDTSAIVWLQAHATPALTAAMQIVSLVGYSGVAMGLAVALAFLWQRRAGAALLVLLTLCVLLTNVAKTTVGYPRPDAVDSRVRALNPLRPEMFDGSGAAVPNTPLERAIIVAANAVRRPNNPLGAGRSDAGGHAAPGASRDRFAAPSDLDSAYGFPSGHVATATALGLGIAAFFGWRRALYATVIWIPLMALSRMYLGRHFPGDVLGGIGVGLVACALALQLGLARFSRSGDADVARSAALRLVIVAAVLAGCALAAGLPRPGDAGRFLGVASGVWLMLRLPGGGETTSGAGGIPHIALAAILSGAAGWTAGALLGALPELHVPARDLLQSMLPALVLLPGPVYVLGLVRPTRGSQ